MDAGGIGRISRAADGVADRLWPNRRQPQEQRLLSAEPRPLCLSGSAHDRQRARGDRNGVGGDVRRSEEHTSELHSLMRISYAVFCLKKKNTQKQLHTLKQSHTLTQRNRHIISTTTTPR